MFERCKRVFNYRLGRLKGKQVASAVDQIKFLPVKPFVLGIVDFKLAVGRDAICRG
jgi:hypothetical protein